MKWIKEIEESLAPRHYFTNRGCEVFEKKSFTTIGGLWLQVTLSCESKLEAVVADKQKT